MHTARRHWLALALLGLLAGAAPVHAQRPQPLPEKGPKRYTHFPADGDLQQILQSRLIDLDKIGDMAEMLEKLKKLAGNMPGADPRIGKLDPADPQLGNKLEAIQKKMQQQHKPDPALLKQIQEALVKQKDLPPPPDAKQPDIDPPHQPPIGLPPKPPPPAPPPQQPAAGQDQLAKWAEQLMRNLEGSRIGDELGDLPAWREMREALLNGKFDLSDVGVDGFRLPDGFNIPLPDLQGLKLPEIGMPQLSRPDLNIPLPNLGGGPPAPGGAPGAGMALAQGLLWVGLGVIVALILWRFAARLPRQSTAVAVQGSGLGPVDPGSVSTPAELIAAFEHLALQRLGPPARSRNHLAIAGGLGGDEAAMQRAADELAALYEQIRYAPARASLNDEQLGAARRNLRLLAGAAA